MHCCVCCSFDLSVSGCAALLLSLCCCDLSVSTHTPLTLCVQLSVAVHTHSLSLSVAVHTPTPLSHCVQLCYHTLSLCVQLCSQCRFQPEAYLQFKRQLINECKKLGRLSLAESRKLLKIDVNKTRKVYDLLKTRGLICSTA